MIRRLANPEADSHRYSSSSSSGVVSSLTASSSGPSIGISSGSSASGTAAVLGDAALVALEDAGWTICAEPAEPLGAARGDHFLAPHAAIHLTRTGELEPEKWRRQVAEPGVAELELGKSKTVA